MEKQSGALRAACRTSISCNSEAYDHEVFLYAFDLLELNGDDLRRRPLEVRKGKLEKSLADSGWGLRFVDHMGGDGSIIFHHACKLRLEGIVSKRKGLGYCSGPSTRWLKTKKSCGTGRDAGSRGRHFVGQWSTFVRWTTCGMCKTMSAADGS
jgi:ATP-dependent DNA ligase